MGKTNLTVLDEALQRAGALVPIPAAVVARLRTLVTDGTDRELLHINPLEFARKEGLDARHAVTAFVAGAKAGAFEFKWSISCALCGSYVHESDGLSRLQTQVYCSMCNRVSESKMDSLVEVAFCVSPSVRTSPGRFGLPLEGEEWLELFQNPATRKDPIVVEALQRNKRWSGLVRGGATERCDVQLSTRTTRVAVVTHNIRATLNCPAGHAGAVVEIHEKEVKLLEYTVASGVVIHNRTAHEAVCAVSLDLIPDDFHAPPGPAAFEGFLSGRDLLCNQAFRDLYSSETLSAGIALSVEAQTVLFTDLKGSTQLYDSIGDLRAFALVSEHFKILLAAVHQCGGAVVKTIGDAVMATFGEATDAVRAALQMASTLDSFNKASELPPLSLKIGIHLGPCIVVNSNDRPDYFGQTVNIAARVQALAEGDELVLTDAAWQAAGVRAQLEGQGLVEKASDAELKGVGGKVKVHTVQLTR